MTESPRQVLTRLRDTFDDIQAWYASPEYSYHAYGMRLIDAELAKLPPDEPVPAPTSAEEEVAAWEKAAWRRTNTVSSANDIVDGAALMRRLARERDAANSGYVLVKSHYADMVAERDVAKAEAERLRAAAARLSSFIVDCGEMSSVRTDEVERFDAALEAEAKPAGEAAAIPAFEGDPAECAFKPGQYITIVDAFDAAADALRMCEKEGRNPEHFVRLVEALRGAP